MRPYLITTLIITALLGTPSAAFAEEPPAGQPRAEERFAKLLEELSKIDISGYIQAEYVADERSDDRLVDGASRNRDEFRVRRGRLKVTHEASEIASYTLQIDASSSGVDLKDAYAVLVEPWTGWRNAVTAGQFKIPFGHEIELSSSRREVPERSRVVRALFPGERDRGVMLSGRPPGTGFGYQLGLFNGSGVDQPGDVNADKNGVAHLEWSGAAFSLGASGYWGTDLLRTPGNPAGEEFDRNRWGVDFQWKTPLPGFVTRGEYIFGDHRGADVEGWYLYGVQKIGTRHVIAVRVDQFDVNTGVADDAVTTFVGAYNLMLQRNTSLMLAYEHPDSEGTDIDDDVITARLQYRY